MASEEDLNAINENLTGVNEDLEELLESSNVFSGDLVINSDATLEFAEALGDKVAIVNGNVDITLQTAMDNARIQAVANKFKTITGNLKSTCGCRYSSTYSIRFSGRGYRFDYCAARSFYFS